ncbi:sodium-dependent phosphate transport protein 2A-like [Tubulanus polymorphus]|uniref:sodium-dependent phosphate transport protein 2A-like n=1 Tax=Tubulanus polymorphus TaxID=672921 RepID=UPI003DA1D399
MVIRAVYLSSDPAAAAAMDHQEDSIFSEPVPAIPRPAGPVAVVKDEAEKEVDDSMLIEMMIDAAEEDIDQVKEGDIIGDESAAADVTDDTGNHDNDDSQVVDTAGCDSQRMKHYFTVCGLCLALLMLLYLFVCSLDLLSSAFRLVAGKAAGGAMSNNELMRNPIAGLMIGILATVLVQSSSTSTSIVVTMVASGMFEVRPAIPIIMGANIGTSVTNTIVSMAQSGQRGEFRRAFSGATVHDVFNWLSVIIFLPIEVASGYLYRLTSLIIKSGSLTNLRGSKQQFLKVVTKPFTRLIVQLDKQVIEMIATKRPGYKQAHILKKWCKISISSPSNNSLFQQTAENVTVATNLSGVVNETATKCATDAAAAAGAGGLLNLTGLDDLPAGGILLVVSLVMLCVCLVLMVKTLNRLLKGSVSAIVNKTLNADFPGRLSWLTGYVAILIGAGLTVIVQSSSIFTSALTPLVGIGVISLERMYPLTLGSNIGTTATGLVAALATTGDKMAAAVQIALCHLLFNISGILLFYPVPVLRRIPIRVAKRLGAITARYRWFAGFYLMAMFFVLPGLVFGLSLAGFVPFISVTVPIATAIVVVICINALQSKRPDWLPKILRSWHFLPEWMRSLAPLDRLLKSVCCCCRGDGCGRQRKPSARRATFDSGISSIGLLNSSNSSATTPANTRPSSRAPSTVYLNINDV